MIAYHLDERQGGEGDGRGVDDQGVAFLRGSRGALEALLLGLAGTDELLVGLVLLGAAVELGAASGRAHVLDAEVEALLQDTVAVNVVDNNADCGRAIRLATNRRPRRHGFELTSALGHVEDVAGAAVVALERHALVLGRVGHDVHVVTNLVVGEERGEVRAAVLAEALGELVASLRAFTMGVRHL